MVFLKNISGTRNIWFFFLNPANHIEFFSVISRSDVEPGSILLNIKHIPIREIPIKAFPIWVFSVIEKVCVLKARLQSSGLRLKHGDIASIKTIHGTKFLWIVLSLVFNMCLSWHHYGRHFYTQPWLIKVHLFYQWPEFLCPYLLGIR